METLHNIVKAGKVHYIGASAMYAIQFQKALHVAEKHGWTRFVSMQNHYNLIYREEEREMMPLCGVPYAHISLAWLRHKNPVVAPVIGATKLPHLESAVVGSLSVNLTLEEMIYLEEPYAPHPIVGLIPYGGQLLSAQR